MEKSYQKSRIKFFNNNNEALNKINFNGKEYNSINDIPNEFKVLFKDENNNGIPDFVEGILNSGQNQSVKPLIANFNSFYYNGTQYSSIDELPPEAKKMVETGLNSLEKTGMGLMMPKVNENIPQGNITQELKNEAQQELQPGFKFRLIMTIIFFVLAVIYLAWFFKIL